MHFMSMFFNAFLTPRSRLSPDLRVSEASFLDPVGEARTEREVGMDILFVC